MKKHIFGIATLSTIFALSVGLIVTVNKPHKEADAYSATSLTSTINLNDCTEQEIRSYYSDLNSLSTSERQGTNLLKQLKPILKNGQQYLNYDSGDNVWKLYEIADRDWEKSPASAITCGSYNPNTNIISNYSYKTENPYLHALYVNRNIENLTRAWDGHTNETKWGMNREHIWAKSHGFQDKGQGGARGDPMHLWAANAYANGIHSNNFYAFVDTSKSYTDCGDAYDHIPNNLSGKSKNAGGSQTVFEPQDCDKGDIARAIFYMAARYNNHAGDDNTIGTNNPNLVLANDLSQNTLTGTSTNSSEPYAMGLLSDLLAWNKLDPVDEYEIHRNNLLYRNYTKNRNPFIDFPEWADAIWGTANLDGTNYNPSINSYATPSSDPINASTVVTPTFAISSNSLNLEVGETANISARNAESTINWTVGNNSVVSLNKTTTTNNDNVTITALAEGTTTVTATSGSDSASCTVIVSEEVIHGDPSTLFTADLTDTASVTDGYTITLGNYSKKTGYYQDSGTVGNEIYFKVMSDSPLFDAVPDTITFTASLGAGNAEDNLVNNVEVCLVNQSGNDITSTRTTVTTSITSAAHDYSVELPYDSSAYGVRLYHVKTSGYNIRFYSFSLSCVGSSPLDPVPGDYLGNVNRIAGLYGSASTVQTSGPVTNAVNVSTLGMNNADDISNINLGHSMTMNGAKASGSNTPKYYTSDYSVRVYGGNTITFESANTMTEIAFTVVNSYGGENLTASTGTISDDVWTGEATSVTFTNTGSSQFRFKNVNITYTGTTSSISVTGMSFKFGITIPQDDWDTIAYNWEISDYGVMIVKENTLVNVYHEDTVEDAHTAGKTLQDLHKGNGDTPYAYESNYLFTVKLNIGANIAHTLRFVASPYIVIDDVYYFLGEIRCSINELAATCLTTGETNLPTDALTYLTTH